MEMDDTDRAFILRPGLVIVLAIIVVSEHACAAGKQLLQAVMRSYEATIGIGRALFAAASPSARPSDRKIQFAKLCCGGVE